MNQHSQLRLATGFSLIEMAIALVILALLIFFALPSFSTWIMNAKIRTAAESIASGLQVARNEAVRRNANIQFVLDATGSGWVVSCQSVFAPSCPNTDEIQRRASGEGADGTISVTATPTRTIVFNSLGLMVSPVNPPGGIAMFDIDGAAASESRELRVTIQTAGNIRMCDPQVSGSDPRAC